MSALQAAVASVQSAQDDATRAESSGQEAVQAAATFGRDQDVQQVDALRAGIDQQAGSLAGTRQALEELLQRAVALQGGGSGGGQGGTAGDSIASAPAARPTLPNADRANLDRRKFTAYSMAPENPRNRGKWQAWGQLGYDVTNRREEAADDVTRQIQAQLPSTRAVPEDPSEYGDRYLTDHVIVGPNGQRGTVRVAWQLDHGADTPRVLTNWLRPHKEGRDR